MTWQRLARTQSAWWGTSMQALPSFSSGARPSNPEQCASGALSSASPMIPLCYLPSCFYKGVLMCVFRLWTQQAKSDALLASCSAETGAMPVVAIELTDPATKKTRVFSPVKDRPEIWEVSLTKTHEQTYIPLCVQWQVTGRPSASACLQNLLIQPNYPILLILIVPRFDCNGPGLRFL